MPFLRFAGVCPSGFESSIKRLLRRALSDSGSVRVSGGLVRFVSPSAVDTVARLPWFTNLFVVFREWNTASLPFEALVRKTGGEAEFAEAWLACRPSSAATFRVRFSRAGEFTSVDKKATADAEALVRARTGLRVDRENPDIEFWYIVRTEGWSALAARIPSRGMGPEERPGELKREVASLLVAVSGAEEAARCVLDPFAGYGSIPQAMLTAFPGARVLASDRDPLMARTLAERFSHDPAVTVACAAVASCAETFGLAPGSVDAIVTDPPWGLWEKDGYADEAAIESLYTAMLDVFIRVCKPGAPVLVLTGAKRAFERALSRDAALTRVLDPSYSGPFGNPLRTDVLINGKKSAVYGFTLPPYLMPASS